MSATTEQRSTAGPEATSDAGPILFFDGECGLCDRFVRFVLDRDPAGRFRFAPLQGPTFAAYRDRVDAPSLSTVVLVDGGRISIRSAAALRVLTRLRWPWPLVGRLGLLVPRPLRDRAYDAVAARRRRWFGPPPACRMPTTAERGRLLP